MQAQIITCYDPFRPAINREVKTVTRKRRIDKLAPVTDSPFICLLNGEPILRKNKGWQKSVKDGDVVAFVVLPQGGGRSNPLQMILAISIAIYAPYFGQAFAQAWTSAGMGLGAFSSTAALGQFAGAVIGFGLTSVVNALIPPPSPPKAQKVSELAAPSPTYSLTAQGNMARLGQPIPVVYGRNVIYPDFIGQPYAEYAGDEQYLYQLFCIGHGQFDIEQIRIDDTVVESNPNETGAFVTATGAFSEIEYQIIYNSEVTAFPANVYTATEVSGQELLQGQYVGGFVVNPSGSQITGIAVDIVLPRGLYFANDAGGLDNRTVSFQAEARAIDNAGLPQGSWFPIISQSITENTTTPIRRSYFVSIDAGRYEVRMTRTNAKDNNVRTGNDVNWGTLRGYFKGNQNYGEVTVLAMKMRASNNLSAQASRKINVIATRKLPTWNGSTWSAPVATRSIAWAIADLCRSSYGMKLADTQIDLAGLRALNTVWNNRLDFFDAVFDSPQTAWDALSQIARCGRALPYMQGGILAVTRDSFQALPTAMFTQRNIVRNSLNLQYIMPSEETADALDVEYWDNLTWQPKTVRASLSGSANETPSNVKLFGCTIREQAWREGMYMAACNRFRRRTLNFETEMEGFIPSVGDLIAIQHDMPQWGLSGEITSWNPTTRVAELSEPVTFSTGTHYMALRTRGGEVSGPYVVVSTGDPYSVAFTQNIDIVPDTGITRERTQFAFGLGEGLYITAKVLSIKPRSTTKVGIYAVVESDFVHQADTGVSPTDDAWQLPTKITVPVILGLFAVSDPVSVDKMFLSWQPAANAEYYIIEVSDSGRVWTRIGETRTANYTAIAPFGNRTRVRVAAVGVTRGPWVEINYGTAASYMWNAVETTLMWNANPATLMWRY